MTPTTTDNKTDRPAATAARAKSVSPPPVANGCRPRQAAKPAAATPGPLAITDVQLGRLARHEIALLLAVRGEAVAFAARIDPEFWPAHCDGSDKTLGCMGFGTFRDEYRGLAAALDAHAAEFLTPARPARVTPYPAGLAGSMALLKERAAHLADRLGLLLKRVENAGLVAGPLAGRLRAAAWCCRNAGSGHGTPEAAVAARAAVKRLAALELLAEADAAA